VAARRRIASRRGWPANLYQNGQGYYWFKNPATGEPFGLGRDFKVAVAQVRTANAELERRKGAVSLLQRMDGADVSLKDYCTTYEDLRLTGNASTISGMKAALNAIRAADFAKNTIGLVTPKEIAAFIRESEATRGPNAAAKIRNRLVDIYRDAIENGLVEVGKSPVESVLKPKSDVKRTRLTLDDFKAILAEARKERVDCWIANAMELALMCGQRREDIAKMKFEDIKDGYLLVEQSKGKEGKRAKLRIPLGLRLDAMGMTLEDVLKKCRDQVLSKNVIHLVRKTGNVEPGTAPKSGTLSIKFAHFRDKAKLTIPVGRTPASFHEIRSLAARLYTEEYGQDFAQALLGHKSGKMTSLYRDVRGREWTEIKLKAG
jgi:integrase